MGRRRCRWGRWSRKRERKLTIIAKYTNPIVILWSDWYFLAFFMLTNIEIENYFPQSLSKKIKIIVFEVDVLPFKITINGQIRESLVGLFVTKSKLNCSSVQFILPTKIISAWIWASIWILMREEKNSFGIFKGLILKKNEIIPINWKYICFTEVTSLIRFSSDRSQ